ncbi:MAG: hypothetical protein HKN17_02135 [Rhodothermales bacterium]|nr:hypothetical protein [Rhodothermales bacterium]
MLREDPVQPGLLYAGTEFGLYLSGDDGASWRHAQFGLPVTPITDLRIVGDDLVLSTMGRGFWIMDDLAPIRQWVAGAGSIEDGPHFFQPEPAFRTRDRSFQASPADPEYADPGVRLHYGLSEETTDPVELSIMGPDGELIRSWTNETSTGAEEAEQGMRGPGGRGMPSEGLDRTEGVHLFVWNMRYPGAERPDGTRGEGPYAVPGSYTATLSIGDWTAERNFEILPDPRALEIGVTHGDMEEQLMFNLRLSDIMTDANRALARIDRALEETDDEQRRRALQDLRSVLETDDEDSYPPPMLISQLSYLSSMTSGADQRPGRDAAVRLDELEEELGALIDQLDEMPGASSAE